MARRTRQREAPPTPAALHASGRVSAVDALRGLAIVAMVAYHFAFDLRFFGLTAADFENDPFWLTARASIVTSFLLLAGISLVLADRAGVDTPRFLRRVALVALCAVAVSVASYVIYPQTFIYFGVLHCIALSLLVSRPLVRKPMASLVAGVVVIVAGLTLQHPVFDQRVTSWIGFTTFKPETQDYVPVFPWLGVVLVGIALGHAMVRGDFAPIRVLGRTPSLLRWMGRHSLAIYMVHQPLLMGAIWLVLRLRA